MPIDLSTTYLGLSLTSPLVPSASPVSSTVEAIRQLEDAGAGAVVLPSLFEEQIESESHFLDRYLDDSAHGYWEATTYYPDPHRFTLTPDQYLEHILRAKRAVDMPIIASLNGVSPGGWLRYAHLIEQAGADALELNVYVVPSDPRVAGERLEETTLELVREVRKSVTIPIAVKLSPYYSNLANLALKLDAIGVDALVLFNRFNQPDFDLDTLEVVVRPLISSDGQSEALRLPLRWIALLCGRVSADLAGTGGVHSATDALKFMMAGASVSMLASALLLHGIDYLTVISRDLRTWLDDREYESIAQLRGSMSQRRVPDPTAFERAHYIRTIGTFGAT
jgi:dihydroorotate dehydrogenase (fumarate)